MRIIKGTNSKFLSSITYVTLILIELFLVIMFFPWGIKWLGYLFSCLLLLTFCCVVTNCGMRSQRTTTCPTTRTSYEDHSTQ